MPEDERAWPALIRAHAELSELAHQDLELLDVRPGDDAWPRIAQLLKNSAPTLDRLRDAAARAELAFPWHAEPGPHYLDAMKDIWQPAQPVEYTENPSLIDVTMTHLGTSRSLLRALATDARLALQEGDARCIASNLAAMAGLARLLRQPTSPVIQLNIANVASVVLMDILAGSLAERPDMPEQDLAMIASALRRAIDERPPPDAYLDFETFVWEDILRRCYRPDGTVTRAGIAKSVRLLRDGSKPESYSLPPGASMADLMPAPPLNLALAALEEYEIACEAAIADPLNVLPPDGPPHIGHEFGWPDSLLAIGDLHMHNLLSADLRARTAEHAALLVVALHRHHLRHDAWPATLADLDDDLLDTPPLDAFTGKPLLYKLTDTGPVIYSAGADRDDDARPLRDADSEIKLPEWIPANRIAPTLESHPASIDGDWILYPPTN